MVGMAHHTFSQPQPGQLLLFFVPQLLLGNGIGSPSSAWAPQ